MNKLVRFFMSTFVAAIASILVTAGLISFGVTEVNSGRYLFETERSIYIFMICFAGIAIGGIAFTLLIKRT